MSKTLDDYAFKDSSRKAKPKSPKKQEKQRTLDGGIASSSFHSRSEDVKRSRNKYYKPEDDNVGERDLGDAQLAPELELDNGIEQSIRDALPPVTQATPRRTLGYSRRKSSALPPSPKPSPKASDVLIVRSTPKKENIVKTTKGSAVGSPAKKATPRPVAIVADSSSSDSDIQPVQPAKRSMSAQSRSMSSASTSQEKTGLTSEMDTLGQSIFPEAYEFESADDQPLVSPERNKVIKASSSAKKPFPQRPIDNSTFYAPSPAKEKGKKRLMDTPPESPSDPSIQLFSPSPRKKVRATASSKKILSDDDLPDKLDLPGPSSAKKKKAKKEASWKRNLVWSDQSTDEDAPDPMKVSSKSKTKAHLSTSKKTRVPSTASSDLSVMPASIMSATKSAVKAKPSTSAVASTSKSKPSASTSKSAFSEEDDFLPPAEEAHLYSVSPKKKSKKRVPGARSDDELSEPSTSKKEKREKNSSNSTPTPKKQKLKKRKDSDESDLEQFLVESDIEERVVAKSGKKRRRKKVVSEDEDEEPDDLEMDFEVLQPTKLRSKSTLGKKTEARNAILAKIRQRKQNKGKPTVIPDSDEEVQPRAASSASEEDPPDQAIDDDDDEDSESGESVKSADFIVEDGEDQEDVRALIPAQFTSEFTQKPIFHFRNFCQLAVLRCLFPNVVEFGDNLEQSRRKISQLIHGILSSLVKSQAWKSRFLRAIELPEFSEDTLDYTKEGCDACKLGGRKSKVEITLSGRFYDRSTFKPTKKANYNSDTSDSDDAKSFMGTEIHTFAVGSECLKKTRCYHDLRHWEWNRVQELEAIVEQYRKTDNSHPRPKDFELGKRWEQQRQRDCDLIMDKLEQQAFVRRNFKELQASMDVAHELYAH